ncbi:MAG: hypothetical protein C0445_00990 [Polaromonas sp.]|nr:hypothetical protein [Polaromonas sp.]
MPPAHTLAPPRRWCLAALGATWALLATGCASVMRVDNLVESHTKWPSSATNTGKVSYIFERLPSQSSGASASAQAELESLASEVLAGKGWVKAAVGTGSSGPPEGSAPWRVQVSATHTTLPRAPWDDPREGPWPHWGLQADNRGVGLRVGGLWRVDMPYHLRRVSVVVRDARQGELAFESTASHDGRWNSSPALWRAMLEAALTDFPTPASGPRQVNLDIPR